MNDEERIFEEVLARGSGPERAAYLDQACAGDARLRRDVEALLAAHGREGGILESPIAGLTVMSEMQPVSERVGSTIGHYKLVEQIGSGGMGVVFLAEQVRPVRRQVALKVIKAGMDTRQVIGRFEAERQTLAIMDHPNIAKVLDAGATESGRPYFVMELVRGVPITTYCDEHHLTLRDRLNLIVQVCNAVQHAHTKGVIHRDLKPTNVMVALYDGKPVPKVIDFGVAKATRGRLSDQTVFTGFGAVVGTPEYMSPEQAEVNQLDVDTRSDVYSLGVIMYELLTDTTPLDRGRFKEAAVLEVLRIVREDEPPKPSARLSATDQLAVIAAQRGLEPKKLKSLVRGELDWIVMRALEKDRTRRYETAYGLALDVQRYLNDEQVLACPQSATYRLRKFARRNKHALSTAFLVALILLAAVGVAGVPATAVGAVVVAMLTTGMVLLAEANRRTRRQREQAEKNLVQAQDAERRAKGAAAKAEAINQFLTIDLLAEAAPEKNAYGNRVTVEELLNRAARTIGRAFSEQPEIEAAVRFTIGKTYYSLGRFDLAEAQLYRVLDLRRVSVGPGHPETLETLNQLAVVLEIRGKLSEAEPLFRRALASGQQFLGLDHPLTLSALHNLAWSLQNRENTVEAEALHRQCLVARRRVLGREHPDTLESLHNLGWVLWDQKRCGEAESLLRETLELRRQVLPAEHPDITKTLALLGWVLMEIGKAREAEPLLQEALAVRRNALPAGHWLTAITANLLGGCLIAQGAYAEAEALLLDSRELLQGAPDFLADRIPSPLDRLVHLYESWGRDEEAARWRAKRDAAGIGGRTRDGKTRTHGNRVQGEPQGGIAQ